MEEAKNVKDKRQDEGGKTTNEKPVSLNQLDFDEA